MTDARLKINPAEVRTLLENGEALGTTIHLLLIHLAGEELDELVDEEPLELVLRLQEEFNVRLHEDCVQRLQAILTAVYTDAFIEDPAGFVAICSALAEGDPNLAGEETVTAPELYWAVWEVSANAAPRDFGKAVVPVIQDVLDNEAEEIDTDREELGLLKYLFEKHNDLREQLVTALGLTPEDVPAFDLSNRQDTVIDLID